jgi:hypothetical protein
LPVVLTTLRLLVVIPTDLESDDESLLAIPQIRSFYFAEVLKYRTVHRRSQERTTMLTGVDGAKWKIQWRDENTLEKKRFQWILREKLGAAIRANRGKGARW